MRLLHAIFCDFKFLDWMILIFGLLLSGASGYACIYVAILLQPINTAFIRAQGEYELSKAIDYDSLRRDVIPELFNNAVTASVMLVCGYASMMCFAFVCERQTYIMRQKLLNAIVYQNAVFFDFTQPGTLIHQLVAGIETVNNGFGFKFAQLVYAVVVVISGATTGFYINPKLSAIISICAPLICTSLILTTVLARRAIKKHQNAVKIAFEIVNEVLSGIWTVITFCGQELEVKRYDACVSSIKNYGFRKTKLSALAAGLFVFSLNISIAIYYFFGTKIIIDEGLPPGVLFAAFWMIATGAFVFGSAAPHISSIIHSIIAIKAIRAIVDSKPEADGAKNKIDSVDGCIELNNVCFSYPGRPQSSILKNVSLRIEPGQKVGFVGHSGCGKSTIASLLMKFYFPTTGSISIDGRSLNSLNTRWLRDTIGFVSQESVIFGATIEENLLLGVSSSVTKDEIVTACRTAHALEFIDALPDNFKTLVGEGGVQLSGGQKQRIAIARALLRNPAILVLDEATSALDTESEHIVQTALDSAAIGRTTICMAHRLSTIRNSDVIFVFNQGTIVESGTHEELIDLNGQYTALVQAQNIEVVPDSAATTNEMISIPCSPAQSTVSTPRTLIMKKNSCEKEYVVTVKTSCLKLPYWLIKFYELAGSDIKYFFCGILWSVLTGLRVPCFAFLMTRIFIALGNVDKEAAKEQCTIATIVFFILAPLTGLTCFLGGHYLGQFGNRVAYRLRLLLYTHILSQDGYFFDAQENSPGILATHLGSDTSNIEAPIDDRLSDVVQSISALTGSCALAFWTSPFAAPFCLIPSIVFVAFQSYLNSVLKKYDGERRSYSDRSNRLATEVVNNVLALQALNCQESVYNNFVQFITKFHWFTVKRHAFYAVIYAFGVTFPVFNFVIVYSIGLVLVSHDLALPYHIYQCMEALYVTTLAVVAFVSYVGDYLKMRQSCYMLFDLLQCTPVINSTSEAGYRPSLIDNINFKRVFFSYPKNPTRQILNKFSVDIHHGQTVALVGQSGCGKSTIIRLLQRLYNISNGSITIGGLDLKRINVKYLRSRMGVVSQDPFLFNLSIKDNIAYGLPESEVKFEDIERVARLAKVDDFVCRMPQRYDTLVGSRGSQLSGGQRQRIAIARALIRNPDILIFDEATSALDSESEQLINDALAEAAEEITCITIAHRLSTIQNADIVVVISEGHVVEVGPPATLLHSHSSLFSQMIHKQSLA